MRIKCVAPYRNDYLGVSYAKGVEFDAVDNYAKWLMRDAPGCFEEVKVKAKSVSKPAVDKAVKAPRVEK